MNVALPWARNRNAVERVPDAVEDLRGKVAEGAQQVAEVAGKLGREWGREAGKLGREVGREAGKLGREVGREASKRGRDWSREAGRLSEEAGKRSREVAVAGTVNARALSRDLSELGRELGELRITRRRQGPDWAPRVALLVGVGSGVAAMYFLDPEQGRRRRALLRDQWMKWTRVFGREATGVAKDVRNRAVGAVHETRRAVEGMTGTIGEQIDVEAPAVEETPDVADELEATDRQRSEVGL